MGKRYKVLYLNGPNKGKEIEVEAPYTEEQEFEARRKNQFKLDGKLYDGWCRECNEPVLHGRGVVLVNVDGLGNLIVDVVHKYCC